MTPGGDPATPETELSSFDFAIIGAGPAGEAAAFEARRRGASVAIVDRLRVGGSCPHIGCIPSKSLLASAGRHAANPATWSWQDAAAHRAWMINRKPRAKAAEASAQVRHT